MSLKSTLKAIYDSPPVKGVVEVGEKIAKPVKRAVQGIEDAAEPLRNRADKVIDKVVDDLDKKTILGTQIKRK
jgi:hypothetical protein